MLARALALEPEVLLLDEPTASLDAAATGAVEDALRNLHGVSLVLVTHDRSQADRLTERAIELREGRVAVVSSTVSITLSEVAASLALIAVAIAVSFWRRAELEQDIAVAVIRSFIQLTAVGYVIQAIFDTRQPLARARAARGDGVVRRRGPRADAPRECRVPRARSRWGFRWPRR